MPIAAPLLAVSAVVGTGLQVYGSIQQSKAASAQNEAQQQILALQQQQEADRQKALELDARRKQVEVLRNAQRARAVALTNATASGSQFGSGLQGGYGQIQGQSDSQLLGINQNAEIGRDLFALNAGITDQRINYGNASTAYATGGGLAALGGNIINSIGTIGRLGGGFGTSTGGYSYGGNYSPYYGNQPNYAYSPYAD